MVENVKKYMDKEYADLVHTIELNAKGYYEWATSKRDYVNRTITDGLAVASFAHNICGADFEKINALYEEFSEKCENLLTD